MDTKISGHYAQLVLMIASVLGELADASGDALTAAKNDPEVETLAKLTYHLISAMPELEKIEKRHYNMAAVEWMKAISLGPQAARDVLNNYSAAKIVQEAMDRATKH